MRRQPNSIILYAFDLLHLDGRDLRQQALIERRASLKTLLGTDERSRIQFSDEFDGDGDALFKACAEQELEGIVSKLALATLSLWSKPNLAQDQVLYRIDRCGDRHGSGPQDRSA